MSEKEKNILITEEEISKVEDTATKAELLLELGLVESFRKSHDKAVKHIEEAQKYFVELHNIPQIASCLAELALIHYQKCNDRLIRSLTLLNDAKYLLENQESKTEAEAKIQHYYGIINFNEKRFSEALKYYNTALKLVTSEQLEYAKILDSLAIYYLRVGNHQIALKYLNDSLNFKKNINSRELSITQLLLGRYLSSIENYDNAIVHLNQAFEITMYLGDYASVARIHDELAKIYINIDNIEKASEHCNQSIHIAEEHNFPLIKAFSTCTLANIKIKNHETDEAFSILSNEAEQVFSETGSTRGFAFVKQMKALTFKYLGRVKDAIENMHEAVELFRESGVSTEVAKCYYELSQVYKNSRDIPMATSSLMEALRIARKNDLPMLTKKIEDLLFELDEEEWSNVINKTAKREEIFTETKSLLDTLALLGDFSKIDNSNKDPLLSLLRIGRSVAAETDVDKLLEIIAEETKKALNADRCTVFLLDRDTHELWSKVALGMGSQEIRFPAHMGLAGHVAMTGETINIKDAYNDPRFNKEIDKKTGYRTRTILCMPMRNLNHEIVGVFQVLNKGNDGTFTDEDEDLLIAIGSSAGIALENARLFKKQQFLYEEQKRSFNSFINTLAASIDARDKITAGHSLRVTGYTVAIANQMDRPPEEIEIFEYAAMLHDFGKIGIKDSVLCKEGKLTDEEYKHIQEHASLTNEILKNMFFEEKFRNVPEIASSHHEKYNGFGYFRGIKGEEIPLGGRILAVSDVFDAITSKRHYRDRMPFIQVLNILRKDSGSHFDGSIVDKFFEINLEQILDVLLSRGDVPMEDEERELFRKYSVNDIHLALLKEETGRNDAEKYLIEKFESHYNPKHQIQSEE